MGHHTFWGFCLWACLAATSLVEGSPKIQGPPPCPKSAIYYQQHCYQMVNNPIPWELAERECQHLMRGGHLASFHTAAEERFVSSAIQQRFGHTTMAWIGMHAVRTPKELFWEWTDGTPYIQGTPLWDNRTPSTTITSHQCIQATNMHLADYTVKWYQNNCASGVPYICKYRSYYLAPATCEGDE